MNIVFTYNIDGDEEGEQKSLFRKEIEVSYEHYHGDLEEHGTY